MIPLRDINPTHSTPVVTIGLIALNVLIFLGQSMQPDGGRAMIWKFGYLPAGLFSDREDVRAALIKMEAATPPRMVVDQYGRVRPVREPLEIEAAVALPAGVKIFTCMFLHAGWMHLLGNMLYLWIFGNNIEDRLGHGVFTFFYLISGLAGSLAHTFVDSDGLIPLVGASGAISGVLGAYILLFPHARVVTLIPIGFYLTTIMVPAWVFLGFYAMLQVLNGLPALTRMPTGGVAYWAHIGGFAVGLALIFILPRRRNRQ
jgi:membrane associated rhomboid family serine protease